MMPLLLLELLLVSGIFGPAAAVWRLRALLEEPRGAAVGDAFSAAVHPVIVSGLDHAHCRLYSIKPALVRL